MGRSLVFNHIVDVYFLSMKDIKRLMQLRNVKLQSINHLKDTWQNIE